MSDKVYKGFKVQLKPNNWQRNRIVQYAGAARFAYNWALQKEMEAFENHGDFISDGDLRKEFTKLKKEKDYKWLQEIYNEVTKQAIKDCVDAFRKYFEKRKKPNYVRYTKKQIEHAQRVNKTLTEYDSQGHPKFKCKWKSEDNGFYLDPVALQLTESSVRIPVLYSGKGHKAKRVERKSSVRLKEKKRIPVGTKYVNPRITYDGENWWLSLSAEIDADDLPDRPMSEGIGIDLGVNYTSVLSNGDYYENINKSSKVRKLEKKKKRLQKQRSKKYRMNNKEGEYKKTKNIIKLDKKILRVDHRISGIREDFRHQMTSQIIKLEPGFIAIEDLNVRGMMKNKHLSKAIQTQGFREIRRQLEYKGKRSNIPVIPVDRWFASSKTCSCCGYKKNDLKLSDRVFKCPNCGVEMDRDYNSSLCIKTYAEQVI